MTNRHNPIGNTVETLLSQHEETQARLQKIRDVRYKFFRHRGLKNLCDNPDLKVELCSQHYVKHFPINIRDAFYGVKLRPQKHITV
jgi:hypothetical protein